jgi:hypothetical protein
LQDGLLYQLGVILGGFSPNPGEIAFYVKLLVLGPITFVLTVLAITLSTLGKGPVLSIVSANPEAIQRMVKTLQGIGLLASMIFTGFLYLKSIGSH